MILRPNRWMLVVVLASLMVLTAGCDRESSSRQETPLTIAAASDLRFAMDDLIADFEARRPGDPSSPSIRVSYGSSGNLFAQLSQRAPFDLYFSADIAYPQKLAEQGHALEDAVFEYAIGRIVIWVPNDSGLDVEQWQWKTLQAPGVRRIAIANPDHAPYGEAALAAVRSAGIFEEVEDRFVYGENISQTAQFIESGAADVGIIAHALAVAPDMEDEGRYWEIPLKSFPRMNQGGLITRWASDAELAQAFRDYVLGPHGQQILEGYGFFLPGDDP